MSADTTSRSLRDATRNDAHTLSLETTLEYVIVLGVSMVYQPATKQTFLTKSSSLMSNTRTQHLNADSSSILDATVYSAVSVRLTFLISDSGT
eukprot:11176529-Ditylum_brightwellii.AAC.1